MVRATTDRSALARAGAPRLARAVVLPLAFMMAGATCTARRASKGPIDATVSPPPPSDGQPASGDGSAATPARLVIGGVPAALGLAADAVPMDVDPATGRILLSSYSTGLWELSWPETAAQPSVARRWTADKLGPIGLARYGPASTVYVNLYGKGLAKLPADGSMLVIGTSAGLVNNDLLALAIKANGEVWVAGVPNPIGGAGFQFLIDDRPQAIISPPRGLETVRSWIEMPERGSLFGATSSGVVEVKRDAPVTLMSALDRTGMVAVSRGHDPGTAVAVGTIVEVWNGTQFTGFEGIVRQPPAPGTTVSATPVDVAVDATGDWFILHADAVLSVIDAGGRNLGQWDSASGVPASPRRVLYIGGRRILIGGEKGLAVVSW
jgi:hypothetical protein